jgi:hypothetical protein
MATNQTLDELRAQIERKYREALNALEIVSAYVGDTTSASAPTKPKTEYAHQEKPDAGEAATKVDRVLGSITSEFKSVEQIAAELNLPQIAIRAALYSKHVRTRVTKKKEGTKTVFKVKAASAHAERNGDGHNMAAMTRVLLVQNPNGLTTPQIVAKIAEDIGKEATNTSAISSALHHMKKRNEVSHNEDGTYRLIN